MTVHAFFPTLVYEAQLKSADQARLNRELLRECHQVREQDAEGRRWSARNYPGGYTSYHSLCRMHQMSSTFGLLEQRLRRHVAAFSRALELDLTERRLVMTDCWINIMPRHTTHPLHIHPLSTLSGTYYVQVPRGSPGLKFEDPRLDRFMASPPRKADARRENRPWITVPAETGKVLLFESWLRHEVAPNPGTRERISISFNYNWF
jgi:uncharacterized protein (TIGR02466 family)